MDEENDCGAEYSRGLGRVWVCSLPYQHTSNHAAHPWHNVNVEPLATWTHDGVLVGYRTQGGEWIDE